MPRQSRSKTSQKPRRRKRKFQRYKLLLDEMFPQCSKLPMLNSHYDLKHVKHDYNLGGKEDKIVFEKAKKEKRILVTKNLKNFKSFRLSKETGIITISDKLLASDLDKKLYSQLKGHSKNYFYGENRRITSETKKRPKR